MTTKQATAIFARLDKAGLEPEISGYESDDTGDRLYEVLVRGAGGWLDRSEFGKLMRILDVLDPEGERALDLHDGHPLRIR